MSDPTVDKIVAQRYATDPVFTFLRQTFEIQYRVTKHAPWHPVDDVGDLGVAKTLLATYEETGYFGVEYRIVRKTEEVVG